MLNAKATAHFTFSLSHPPFFLPPDSFFPVPCANSIVILPSFNSCISTSPAETGFRWGENEKAGAARRCSARGRLEVTLGPSRKRGAFWKTTGGPHTPRALCSHSGSASITVQTLSGPCRDRIRNPSLRQLPRALAGPDARCLKEEDWGKISPSGSLPLCFSCGCMAFAQPLLNE